MYELAFVWYRHTLMLFNSPLSSEKANKLIELLDLSEESRVLDVGCGTGEFLIRVAERYGAHCLGLDIRPDSLEQAQKSAKDRIPSTRIAFKEVDVRRFEAEPHTYDCGICMGASHAFATDEPAYPETLNGFLQLVRPGGFLLIGESYWMKGPSREYLDFIGKPLGTYRTHLENVDLAKAYGLIPYYAICSTLEEWDDFEWQHNIQKEKDFLSNPNDPTKQKAIEFSRQWRNAYLRWGRGTMGFAFYLFRIPS